MRIIYFKEGEPLQKEDIFQVLEDKNVNEMIIKLQLSRILNHYLPKKNLNAVDVYGSEYYVFNYVGMIVLENIIIVVYPKYIKDMANDIKNNFKKFKQIIQIIEKYQSISIYNQNSEVMIDNFLSLQIYILHEYMENGLYENFIIENQINTEGVINWEKTINETNAYIINEKPFYLELYAQNSVTDERNIIRNLHMIILTEISKNLGPLMDIFNLPEVYLSDDQLDDYGTLSYLEGILESELNIQFIDYKKVMLESLINYIKQSSDFESEDSKLLYFGTNSFNLVWEDVCKKNYTNNLQDSLTGLQLNLTGNIVGHTSSKVIDYRQRETLADVIEKPLWINLSTQEEFVPSRSYQLDVLHVNHQEKRFEIYDAKYYDLFDNDSFKIGQIGMSDLSKQYFYQLAYKRLATINDYEILNFFVVPVDELSNDNGKGVRISKITLDIFDHDESNEIIVIARDTELFYSQYLLL